MTFRALNAAVLGLFERLNELTGRITATANELSVAPRFDNQGGLALGAFAAFNDFGRRLGAIIIEVSRVLAGRIISTADKSTVTT